MTHVTDDDFGASHDYGEALTLAPTPDNRTDIVGQYEAFIVVTHVAQDVAAHTLPHGFKLMPPSGTPKGMHPVMYAFGKHRHVHNVGSKLLEYDYDEALIGLPHIGVPRQGKLMPGFFMMIDVRLNSHAAFLVGKALGFPKQEAAITNTDTHYEIADGSRLLMRADLRIAGRKFNDTHPHFAMISPLMQQPVASRLPTGNVITTGFSIDTARAFMVPATMELEVVGDALAGLPKGRYRFDSIEKSAFDGAYMSVHSWRMTLTPEVIV